LGFLRGTLGLERVTQSKGRKPKNGASQPPLASWARGAVNYKEYKPKRWGKGKKENPKDSGKEQIVPKALSKTMNFRVDAAFKRNLQSEG